MPNTRGRMQKSKGGRGIHLEICQVRYDLTGVCSRNKAMYIKGLDEIGNKYWYHKVLGSGTKALGKCGVICADHGV